MRGMFRAEGLDGRDVDLTGKLIRAIEENDVDETGCGFDRGDSNFERLKRIITFQRKSSANCFHLSNKLVT